jgi:hypothetical protein
MNIDETLTSQDDIEELKASMLPPEPTAGCKHCYGRGHIGLNGETQKWRPCPKCYPGAAESTLTPREIIAATLAVLEDPLQLERLMAALQAVGEDDGESADEVLVGALAAIPDPIVDGDPELETKDQIRNRAERDGAAHGKVDN